jgi:hypothetical protein
MDQGNRAYLLPCGARRGALLSPMRLTGRRFSGALGASRCSTPMAQAPRQRAGILRTPTSTMISQASATRGEVLGSCHTRRTRLFGAGFFSARARRRRGAQALREWAAVRSLLRALVGLSTRVGALLECWIFCMEAVWFPNRLNEELLSARFRWHGEGGREGKVREWCARREKALSRDDGQAFSPSTVCSRPCRSRGSPQRASAFWFRVTEDIVANHLVSVPDPKLRDGRKNPHPCPSR